MTLLPNLQDALTDQLASAAAEAWRAGEGSSHTTMGALALIHLLNSKGGQIFGLWGAGYTMYVFF
jgi:hypothetical protein